VADSPLTEELRRLAALAVEVEAKRARDVLKGDKGDVGARGLRGEPGEQGQQGEYGEPGDMGEPGETGPPGKQGERGLPGPQGIQGKDGKPGPKGERGIAVIGLPGEPGERGEQGIAGILGLPTGGETGQVLAKASDADDDLEWIDLKKYGRLLQQQTGPYGGFIGSTGQGTPGPPPIPAIPVLFGFGVPVFPAVPGVEGQFFFDVMHNYDFFVFHNGMWHAAGRSVPTGFIPSLKFNDKRNTQELMIIM
jgi:Collagen triple helix repeat (20 copies)